MFTVGGLLIGALAAIVIGVSKAALPGAGLLAVPLFAMVAEGRGIPGVALPVLLFGDVLAVRWYRQHTRWDLLRPLALWVAVGMSVGSGFFVVSGSNTRVLDVAIASGILLMVVLQVVRIVRQRPPRPSTPRDAAVYGTGGGFTTFVSNAAGPIINTYLVGLGLDKRELVGTSAWFYLAVNLTKVPVYLLIGELASGGRFFTWESLAYNLVLLPAVVLGVYVGRHVLHRLPERFFLWTVLVLSFAGALKLVMS